MPLPTNRPMQHDELLQSFASIAHSINSLLGHIPLHSDGIPSTATLRALPSAIVQLPEPLAPDLIALGIKSSVAESLSRSYLWAAGRLKVEVEARCTRVIRACIDATIQNGCTVPEHLSHIRVFYETHFSDTVTQWAQKGLSMTRERLMVATLKRPLAGAVSPKTNPTPLPPRQNLHQQGFLSWTTSRPHSFTSILAATDAQGKLCFNSLFKNLTPVRDATPSQSSPSPASHRARTLSPKLRKPSPGTRYRSPLSIIRDPFSSRLPPYAFPAAYITEEAEVRRQVLTSQKRDFAIPVLCRGLRKVSTSPTPSDIDMLSQSIANTHIQSDGVSGDKSPPHVVTVKKEELLPPISFPLSLFPLKTPEPLSFPVDTKPFEPSPAKHEDVSSPSLLSAVPRHYSPPSPAKPLERTPSSCTGSVAESSSQSQPPVTSSPRKPRKIAPIPKRLSRGPSKVVSPPTTDTQQPSSKAAVSLESIHSPMPTKFSTHPSSSPSSASEPKTPPRTRKVAPLPKRRSAPSAQIPPISNLHPSPILPPFSSSPSPPGAQPYTGLLPSSGPPDRASNTLFKRTPSLTATEFSDDSRSSSSSRSSSIFSSSSSSSRLLTPPSSPSQSLLTSVRHPDSNLACSPSQAWMYHPSIYEAPPSPDMFGSMRHAKGGRATGLDLQGIAGDLFHPDEAVVSYGKQKGKGVDRVVGSTDEFG
ncbi:uncharacterized protein STEHIDRAFT_151567 [Stereum hirsutum FP-91666 SS1]|uniref:uncharacterized protein n=1 Tax=Stereum hirsutum (strain FP-91666) TaxID=721885 RepID=UPI000440DFA1|nr:uncharacterized protein STEHIDRAFT_151567 [Stereum hirsutum FP-91666 SS1]EIM92230.1 hypothetical protein STEHIDRAFT_151567 [Stereum hirsutum FP-91666 SS1]